MLVHLLIVLLSYLPGIRGIELATSLSNSDEVTYIQDARNILENGVFSREQTPPFLWEPYRTPGLPILIVLSMWLTGTLLLVPVMNVLFAGLAAWFGTKLLELYTTDTKIIRSFGLLLAFLPNALGTDCYVLTDSSFAYLNIIWLYFLIQALKQGRWKDIGISSLALLCAQLIKPTLSVGFVFVGLFISGSFFLYKYRLSLIKLIAIFTLSLVAPLFLSYNNYNTHGVFTPTLLGEETKREYLTANYFSYKTGRDYYNIQSEIRDTDKQEAKSGLFPGKTYYGILYGIKKHKNDSITHADPVGMLKAFTIECGKQIIAPQEFIFQVFIPDPGLPLRVAGAFLNLFYLILVAAGCLILWRKQLRGIVIMIFLFYAFYIFAGSMSSRQGGRFRLPADLIALPAAAIGLSIFRRNHARGTLAKP